MSENVQVAKDELERKAEDVNALVPPVDIFEDETGITLLADVPGVSKDRLEIKVVAENLLLEAQAATPVPAGMEVLYSEVRTPYYRRNFTLSRELDSSKIEANLSHGILKLRIPKMEKAKPRRIDVKVG